MRKKSKPLPQPQPQSQTLLSQPQSVPAPALDVQQPMLWMRARFEELQINQRLYVLAMLCLVGCLSMWKISQAHGRNFFILFLVFWILAIAKDSLELFKKIQATVLGKALLTVLLALSTNIAISVASLVVNNVTGVDPSKFPHTLAFVSILLIPFLALGGLGMLYLALLLVTPLILLLWIFPAEGFRRLVLPGYKTSTEVRYPKITLGVQLVSAAVFTGFMFQTAALWAARYDSFLDGTTRSFIYHLEMYGKAPCSLPEGSRAAFIAEERVLLGKKSGDQITVKLAECKITAMAAPQS